MIRELLNKKKEDPPSKKLIKRYTLKRRICELIYGSQ